MNIQQLRYVVATSECGSMTAAAATLYVAQPALSRAIRLLERELKVTLFSRAGRGIALTTEGEAFVARARKILLSLDSLRGIGEREASEAQLVIAASPTLQVSMALPILSAFREHGIEVQTRLIGAEGSSEVHDLVRAGRADLGICDRLIPTELTVVPIGQAEVRLVSPPGLDLADPFPVVDLAGLPLVLPTVGTDRRADFELLFGSLGIAPTVAIESDERSVWLEAVLRGLASCIWHSVDSWHIPTSGVVLRSFDPPIFQELCAVHHEEHDLPAKVLLLEVLREFANLAAR